MNHQTCAIGDSRYTIAPGEMMDVIVTCPVKAIP